MSGGMVVVMVGGEVFVCGRGIDQGGGGREEIAG